MVIVLYDSISTSDTPRVLRVDKKEPLTIIVFIIRGSSSVYGA